MMDSISLNAIGHQIAASLTGRICNGGALLVYQLASLIGGGPASLIAAWLFRTFQFTTAIAVYVALCTVITFVATAAMTGHSRKDLTGEHRTPGLRAQI
jgi:hypothetical protein